MASSYTEDVEAFHARMRRPTMRARSLYTRLELAFRREDLLEQEVAELGLTLDAYARSRTFTRRAEVLHELCDCLYSLLGVVVECELTQAEIEAAWDEIHTANMAKQPNPHDRCGKAIKPEGWRKPDVIGVLRALRKAGR